MHHLQRIGAASVVVVLLVLALAAPMAKPRPASAAGSCGTYRSETVPPPTIRVFRTATGAVETVDFRTYVKNVLSREWISTWTTESLRSGALAVKNYGWYQVLHWRGYVNEDAECFDVFDSTRDQHYDPTRPTYASMATAVDATWSTLAQKSGRIFATYYNAGAARRGVRRQCERLADVPVGHPGVRPGGQDRRADPRHLLRRCRRHGGTAGIHAASFADAAPDRRADAEAHARADRDAHAVTGLNARRDAGADANSGTHADRRSDADRPQPPAQPSPGGGQVGLVRPPPPPPPNPEPIVVTTTGTGGSLTPSRRAPIGATRTHVRPLLDTDRLPPALSHSPRAMVPIGIGRLSVDAFLELYLGGLLDRWSITAGPGAGR